MFKIFVIVIEIFNNLNRKNGIFLINRGLKQVEKLFLNKVPDKYYDRKFEGFVPYEKE